MRGFNSVLLLTVVIGSYAALVYSKHLTSSREDEPNCEKECCVEIFEPVEGSCTFYYQYTCAFEKVCQMCPLGTVWIQELENCDYPPSSEHECWNNNIEVQAKEACSQKDGNCINQLFSNPLNCSTYYQCDNGKAILRDCPRGTVWDDKAHTCNFGDGCPEPVCGPEPKCNGTMNDKNSTAEYYACEADDTKYYECIHNIAVLRLCPDGTVWKKDDPPCGTPCEDDNGCGAKGKPNRHASHQQSGHKNGKHPKG